MRTIPLMVPYVTDKMRASVAETLQTRWIGQGPKVEEFELAFERALNPDVFGERSAVAVSSGTAALHLAYILAGIQSGDTVLCPLFTCTATNIPLLYLGANIHFVDVEPGGLNMDNTHLAKLSNELNPKAIVVVHYGGAPAQPVLDCCAPHPDSRPGMVPVIEDCAQALGAKGVGRTEYACYSFQAVKHVTTGDGGMLMCPPEKAAEAKRRRWFGIDRAAKLQGTWANDICEVGYKYQMTDIEAAMGLASLEDLDSQMEHRHAMRAKYRLKLAKVSGIRVIDQSANSACWLMTVDVERREDLMQKLSERGIENGLVHYRNDRYKIFEQFRRPGQFPNMDAMESRYLVLPMHMGMGVEDVEYICSVIKEGW